MRIIAQVSQPYQPNLTVGRQQFKNYYRLDINARFLNFLTQRFEFTLQAIAKQMAHFTDKNSRADRDKQSVTFFRIMGRRS